MTQTVAEYLAETKASGTVSEEVFRAYADSDVSDYSSWGVWGKTTFHLTVFSPGNRPWEGLRSDVFLMGGNTGLLTNGALKKFANFHAEERPADSKLKQAVRETPLAGAFMSDIVKNAPTKNAGGLLEHIEAGEVSIVEQVVAPLQSELDLLQCPERVTVVVLGKDTVKVWDRVMSQREVPDELLTRLNVLTGLDHHTAFSNLKGQIQDLLHAPMQPHTTPRV
jgi:hypothetical protein